jgi:hypothetical protein
MKAQTRESPTEVSASPAHLTPLVIPHANRNRHISGL